MVCFYIRFLSLQDEPEPDDMVTWFGQYPLKSIQMDKLRHLMDLLQSEYINDLDLDNSFHNVIKELFCWTESRKLLEEIDCPVQRFLMVACLRDEGNAFIHVRDITPNYIFLSLYPLMTAYNGGAGGANCVDQFCAPVWLSLEVNSCH